jgi:hypothetical protein
MTMNNIVRLGDHQPYEDRNKMVAFVDAAMAADDRRMPLHVSQHDMRLLMQENAVTRESPPRLIITGTVVVVQRDV